MENSIKEGQRLVEIERNIEKEVSKCEFWGDLELSVEELEILKESLRAVFCMSGNSVYSLCKSYPHAITTYMVFFVRYKYDVNFWGVISDELGIELPEFLQGELGRCARRMFAKYNMDTSETKDETKRRIAPIMYEACLPPESSLDDLFYIMSHDTIRAFDPQIIIEELLEMRSYSIRKPMYRFLKRFKDDRAVDFVLEVRDAMLAVDQRNTNSSRFIGNYVEWKEEEKTKAVIANKKNLEYQAKPYLFFDNGNKGLCIVLPHIVMESEWVEEVIWRIKGDNGFYREICGVVLGDEGRRYTDVLVVPVAPSEKYTIYVNDSEDLDDKGKKDWEIDGIRKDKVVFFNSNGRQINANYLLSPYGIMIIPNTIRILEAKALDVSEQYYPTKTDDYRIVSVSPLSNEAKLKYEVNNMEYSIVARPQVNMRLEGKTLFSLPDYLNIFTKVPTLIISVDGEIVTDGMEIRIGANAFVVSLNSNEENAYNIGKIAKDEFDNYGTYSIRLYRFGKFLKQIEFSLVPNIKSNYSPIITWPSLSYRKEKLIYKFQRLEDWEIDFEGCTVASDDSFYHVTIPSNAGSVLATLKSLQAEFRFECGVELPIRPFEAEIVDIEGNPIENITDKLFKSGLDGFTDSEKWITLRTFGEYKTKNYQIRIKNANGIEQIETVRLTQNGSGNFNLAAFNDTIRNCPLPAEIELICDGDEEKTIPFLLINEKLAMEKKVGFKRGEKKSYITLGIEDDGKDISIKRFGFDRNEVFIPYSKSVLGNSGKQRGYVYPNTLNDGIYIISGNKEQAIFEFEEDSNIELTVDNNVILVSGRDKNKALENIAEWLDYAVGIILNTEANIEFQEYPLKEVFLNLDLALKLEKKRFEDKDIEKLVALAYFVHSKIIKSKKEHIMRCMRMISANFMHRGDRYRIIELLVELDAPQDVFETCLKQYSLLLVYSDNSKSKELAGKVEKYSVELSMLLMMSMDGPIRDCMWREKYRELIGKESIRKLLSVPREDNMEIIAEEQKKFLREVSGSRVRIRLDDEISGNEEAIQGMITYDKKGNPFFDISKKPDYGIYFARIKYVDQYVNWIKNTHDRNMNMDSSLRKLMINVVKDNYFEIMKCIDFLKIDTQMCDITKQYIKVLEERFHPGTNMIPLTAASYPRYFYVQGLAAFLAKLPVDRERLDDFRKVGIKFMSTAYIIAPRLSERDIIMASTYIYLKRKEEKLCR